MHPLDERRPSFGGKVADSLNKRLSNPASEAAPALDDLDGLVLYSARLRRGTYLRLVQLAYHKPGNFTLQDFVEKAIQAALDAEPEAGKAIPEPDLSDIIRKNKKLRA